MHRIKPDETKLDLDAPIQKIIKKLKDVRAEVASDQKNLLDEAIRLLIKGQLYDPDLEKAEKSGDKERAMYMQNIMQRTAKRDSMPRSPMEMWVSDGA